MAGVKVELKEAALKRVYEYEDENLKLVIPIPGLEVFEAVVRELDRLRKGDDAESCVTVLARAFWLLHQRPEETGVLWWRKSRAPKVDEREAMAVLENKVKSVEVARGFLPPALFGFINHVMGGGKADGEPRDYQARIEPSI